MNPQDAARRELALLAQIAQLRRELDETRTVLARLESVLDGQTSIRPAITLEPGPHTIPGNSTVRQILPTGAWELAGIDVYWSKKPESRGLFSQKATAPGEIRFTLASVDDGAVLGQWQIAAASLRPGWMRLPFPKVLARQDHFLELRAEWTHPGNGGAGPSLALTADSLDASAEPALLDGVSCGQPLALRLWAGVAGMKLPPWAQDGAAPRRFAYRVDFAKAQRTSTDTPADYFSILDGGRRLRLHPAANAIHIARVPDACASGALRVSARVRTAHPNAPKVEYALWLAPPQDPPLTAPPSSRGASTGWVTAPPDTDMPLHLDFDRPTEHTLTLYLATRYAPRQHAEYAWADWLEVEILLEE